MTDPNRQRVLDAVADGRLPAGGPSHLAALDLLDEVPGSHWEEWNENAAERIRAAAARPACICAAPYADPGADGRCSRCQGFVP
jgi:hypothetical protein